MTMTTTATPTMITMITTMMMKTMMEKTKITTSPRTGWLHAKHTQEPLTVWLRTFVLSPAGGDTYRVGGDISGGEANWRHFRCPPDVIGQVQQGDIIVVVVGVVVRVDDHLGQGECLL